MEPQAHALPRRQEDPTGYSSISSREKWSAGWWLWNVEKVRVGDRPKRLVLLEHEWVLFTYDLCIAAPSIDQKEASDHSWRSRFEQSSKDPLAMEDETLLQLHRQIGWNDCLEEWNRERLDPCQPDSLLESIIRDRKAHLPKQSGTHRRHYLSERRARRFERHHEDFY